MPDLGNKRPHNWRPASSRHARGYGTAHDRIRRAMLREEPHCRECRKEGRETRATHADHIIPKCMGGADERSNYQPLCVAHSRSKTGREGALIANARRRARKALEAAHG
jgi:5-methylcytosine-specific restriction protein A